MSDTRVNSIFGTYAQNLQALIDVRLDKFKVPFFPQYFSFGTPQAQLTFASVIGRSRIEAAASVVAHGAAAPLRSRANLEKLNGEVAAIKVARDMNESDYRNYLTIQAMNLTEDTKKQQILKLLWEDISYVGNTIMDRLDIMAAQAMSEGIVRLSAVTNPDGLILSDIDLLMPIANKKKVAVVWSAANAATMTPITDLNSVVDAAEAIGVQFEKILMTKAVFRLLSNATETLNALKGFLRLEKGALSNPTLEQVNTYLVGNLIPPIELVSVTKSIEKDGKLAPYNPWKTENVSFVPAGKLGTIQNAVAIESISPVPGTTYATYNNALIKKWKRQSPFAEITEGELNAFPSVEAIESIFILTTDVAVA